MDSVPITNPIMRMPLTELLALKPKDVTCLRQKGDGDQNSKFQVVFLGHAPGHPQKDWHWQTYGFDTKEAAEEKVRRMDNLIKLNEMIDPNIGTFALSLIEN